MLPGVPCIYYDDEIGMKDVKDLANCGFFLGSRLIRKFWIMSVINGSIVVNSKKFCKMVI